MATPKHFVGPWRILHWCPGSLPENLVQVSDHTREAVLEIGPDYTLQWSHPGGTSCAIRNPPLAPAGDDELRVKSTKIEGPEPISLTGARVRFLLVVTLGDDLGEGNPGTIIAEAHPNCEEGFEGE